MGLTVRYFVSMRFSNAYPKQSFLRRAAIGGFEPKVAVRPMRKFGSPRLFSQLRRKCFRPKPGLVAFRNASEFQPIPRLPHEYLSYRVHLLLRVRQCGTNFAFL